MLSGSRSGSRLHIYLDLEKRPRLGRTRYVTCSRLLGNVVLCPSYYPIPSRQRFRGVPLSPPRTRIKGCGYDTASNYYGSNAVYTSSGMRGEVECNLGNST